MVLQQNTLGRRKSVAEIISRYDCHQNWVTTFRQQLSLKRVLIGQANRQLYAS